MNTKSALRKRIVAAIVALGAILAAGVNPAAAYVVYDVDLVSGSNSVVGTITTVGLGTVGQYGYTSWNLQLTAGSYSALDRGTNTIAGAEIVTFGAVTATSTALIEDFSAGGNISSFLLSTPGAALGAYNFGPAPKDGSGFTLYFPQPGSSYLAPEGFIPEPKVAGIVIGRAESMQAPEIDTSSAAAGLTLLAGILLIFRGRRPLGTDGATIPW